jgi:hypothetical protein
MCARDVNLYNFLIGFWNFASSVVFLFFTLLFEHITNFDNNNNLKKKKRKKKKEEYHAWNSNNFQIINSVL